MRRLLDPGVVGREDRLAASDFVLVGDRTLDFDAEALSQGVAKLGGLWSGHVGGCDAGDVGESNVGGRVRPKGFDILTLTDFQD